MSTCTRNSFLHTISSFKQYYNTLINCHSYSLEKSLTFLSEPLFSICELDNLWFQYMSSICPYSIGLIYYSNYSSLNWSSLIPRKTISGSDKTICISFWFLCSLLFSFKYPLLNYLHKSSALPTYNKFPFVWKQCNHLPFLTYSYSFQVLSTDSKYSFHLDFKQWYLKLMFALTLSNIELPDTMIFSNFFTSLPQFFKYIFLFFIIHFPLFLQLASKNKGNIMIFQKTRQVFL